MPAFQLSLEDRMELQFKAAGLPRFERQLRFAKHIGRQWRFDFAWPRHKIALEVDGGTWVNGRHGRGAGMESDAIKQDCAVLLGWRVLRVTTDMVDDGRALAIVEFLFGDNDDNENEGSVQRLRTMPADRNQQPELDGEGRGPASALGRLFRKRPGRARPGSRPPAKSQRA